MKGLVVPMVVVLGTMACDQGEDPFAAVREDGSDSTGADVLWPETEIDLGPVGYSGLVINEVESAGEPDDWFEIYNGGTTELDLTGVGFSDDPSVVKATFPVGTRLAAGRHLVVITSDTTVGFKLGKVESLVLSAPDGVVIDQTSWDMEAAAVNTTWGRFPDGSGVFQRVVASPGGSNSRPAVDPDPDPDPDPVTRCGNGQLDGGEACDGDLLRDMDCTDFGFDLGTLACDARCDRFDTAACVSVAKPDVVLNEVTSSGDDAIEILNRGPDPVDLGGWAVSDDGYLANDPTTADHRWVFPAGWVIAPGQRQVLRKGSEHPFGLGGEDRVTL